VGACKLDVPMFVFELIPWVWHESSSAAVGSLVCTVQLISSASIRAGMHEAIRRMCAMAAATRSASLDSGGY